MLRDENGESPLHVAMHGKPELVAMLVKKGADIGATCDLG